MISQEVFNDKIRAHRRVGTLGFVCKTWKTTNKKELMKLQRLEKRIERHSIGKDFVSAY